MKSALLLAIVVFASPMAFAQEGRSELKLESQSEDLPSDYKVSLVPQVGMASMSYTGKMKGDKGQGFSGGLTTELGSSKARLLEVGLLFVQSKSTVNDTNQTISTSQLGIPLMAKLRFIDMKSQSWYAKIGALTTFQTSSNEKETRSMDVLGSVGVGARVPLERKMDILIEATFNRGIMNAFLNETSVQEGLLVFTGISIAL